MVVIQMKVRPRNIRNKLEAGERAYGFAVQLPSPDLVEIAGALGYDYAWIDAEHGSLGLSEIRELIRGADAAGMDSIVRVADHEPSFIQRVLDLGATGIMVPHVRTVDEAKAIAASVRYSPLGIRGACPSVRSVGHITTDWTEDYTRADADVLVFGLIEDIEGLVSVEAIARDGGLDGLVYGPFDLGMALGLDGDVSHPQLRAHHDRVAEACKAAGIEYVAASLEWEFGALNESGARIVTVAGDRGVVFSALSRALAEVRMAGTPATASHG
ncbi:aldolase/citrate lyase family protein [Herbiconiux sp.]|uniref:HpcH/HpaI aldolase family protein n=1 Tax=Herbiconiux sp. TaxID=1871186 RepID=UPI0025BE3BFF|nr:aldolase/citrate lyase family protein [Herbiconiux sp.]